MAERPEAVGRKKAAVVLDTNVFVAAGFNRDSSSARIIDAIERGRLELVWNRETRRETEAIVRRIPPLRWERFAPLFRANSEYTGAVEPDAFRYVEDPDDRKFAALTAATGAALITNDDHLLAHRAQAGIRIRTPAEFVERGEGG